MKLYTPQDQPRSPAPPWLITFADMVSLLMGFFILLLSFSKIETEKFRTISGSMRNALGLEAAAPGAPGGSGSSPGAPSAGLDSPRHAMMVTLRRTLEQSELKDQGSVEVTDRGVALRLPGDAVFATGQTELKAGAFELLDGIVRAASSAGGDIEVEGHSDDVPIHTSQYPSNWELSTARAGSAVRYLTSRGIPATRLKAIGYADSRPLAANTSVESRARNRRVEFLFVYAGDASPVQGARE